MTFVFCVVCVVCLSSPGLTQCHSVVTRYSLFVLKVPLNTNQPAAVPGRSLRSSQSNLLSVPLHKLNFGARSFRVAAPSVWNSLPADIRACTFYGSFIRHLKTYFNNAF